jgi:hypothetical protein
MTWVTQGPIADRTREMLVDTDRGIPVLRRLYFEQIERVQAGQDPLGIVRDPRDNVLIELPQSATSTARATPFLAESVAMSHVRYSPIRDQILDLLASPTRAEPVRIFCHAQHLSGVGHFVRMRAIARGLRPAHDVVLVHGGRPMRAARSPAPATPRS